MRGASALGDALSNPMLPECSLERPIHPDVELAPGIWFAVHGWAELSLPAALRIAEMVPRTTARDRTSEVSMPVMTCTEMLVIRGHDRSHSLMQRYLHHAGEQTLVCRDGMACDDWIMLVKSHVIEGLTESLCPYCLGVVQRSC